MSERTTKPPRGDERSRGEGDLHPSGIGPYKLALTAQEAAELTGLCTKTIYQLAHRADFPAIRVGPRIRIPRRKLEEWLEAHIGEDVMPA